MSTSLGTATLDLRVQTAAALTGLQQFGTQALAQLRQLEQATQLRVRLDTAQALAEAAALKQRLQADLVAGLKLDLSGLQRLAAEMKSLTSDLARVAGELKDAADRLKVARSGQGGGEQGGGGPPSTSPSVPNMAPYAAQLRALQGDLRGGAQSAAQFEAATRALKASIDAQIGSLRSAVTLTRAQDSQLLRLRVTSGQAAQAIQQQAAAQARAAQQAAAAQAQALRQTAQAQSESVARLGRDLQTAQSQYSRGTLSLREYLRELERVRTTGQGMAGGLAAGSREAANLERVMGGLSKATRSINDQSITKIRTDLAAARAEFERATAAAGRFADKRAAINAYEASMRQLEGRIRAVGERSTTTASQLGQLNRLSAQLGSQRNTLNLTPTGLGISGSILTALKSLPQFASVAGGSLGAAAAQASSLGGALGGVAALGGPVGIAIGVVTVAVAALTAGLVACIGTAAQFEQTLADIKALTQPTAEQLKQLTAATFQIGQPLGVSARDAASAVLELNKAGLSAKDVIGGGLKGALELAGAAGISAAEGSRLAVSAMTAFGMQSQQLPRIADVFANFSNKTFLGAEDLSQAIAAVGPVARSSGIQLQQFGGIMATLAQGGFKNMSDAGTSLKTMLLSLQSPSDTGAKYLKAIGVSAFDAKGGLRPFTQTLSDIRGELIKLTPEAQKKLLKEIFGTDAIRAAEILLREGPKAINANTQAMGKQGEAARVAKERLESLTGAGKQFGAAFDNLKNIIGAPFLAALAGIVRGATGVVLSFTELVQLAQQGQGALGAFATSSNQALSALGGIVQTVFGGIKAAWDSVLWPVLQVLGSVWMVIQQSAMTALTLLLNVVNGIFQGVAAAITTLLQNFGIGQAGIAGAMGGVAETVQRGAGIARLALVAVGRFAATLPEAFKLMGTGVGTVLTGVARIMQGFGQAGRAVFLAAGASAAAFASALGRNAQGIGQIIRGMGGVFLALAGAVRNAFVEKAGQILGAGVRLFGRFSDGVGSVLGQVAGVFFNTVVRPVYEGASALLPVYNRVVGIVTGAANAIGKVLAPIGNVLKALGLNIGEALAGAAQAAASAATGVVDSFAGAAQAAYSRAQAAAQAKAEQAATSTANGVAGALEGAGNALQKFASDNGTGQALDQALGQVQGGLRTVATSGAQLRTELNGVQATLTGGLAEAGKTAAAGLGEIKVGAELTGAALDYVKGQAQDAVAGFNTDLKALATTAKTTAAAVATIKPPAAPTQLASGTKTLADLGLGGKSGKGSGAGVKTTAADMDALARYKEGLKGYTAAQLTAARAEAIRTNNKGKLGAILAEEARRQREATSAGRAAATQGRQNAAEAQRDADTRANLVREIRQSIAAFKLQADQGKVTAQSQLAFTQRMEDFRSKVAKLPPALQSGTQALFDQAAALARSTQGQAAATRQVALSGAALIKYKEALRGKNEQQLKDLEAEARAENLGPQLNAILAERTRRTNAQTAAGARATAQAERERVTLERNQATRADLVREIRQTITAFDEQVKSGRVSSEQILAFSQRMEDLRSKVAKLPPELQKGTGALFDQGVALVSSGKEIVARTAALGKLTETVQIWTRAELEAARVRVLANASDPDQAAKLKLIDDQLGRLNEARAQAGQQIAETETEVAKAGTDGVLAEYERRRTEAEGHLARLLALELEYGDDVEAARNAQAKADADKQKVDLNKKFNDLVAANRQDSAVVLRLEEARARGLKAIDDGLLAARQRNATDRTQSLTKAQADLDSALLTADRETRASALKVQQDALQRQTAALEAQQQEELDAEDLTEVQKLAIREKYRTRLIEQKRLEVEASRSLEIEAENARYADAVEAARKNGTLDRVQGQLQQQHLDNLALLNRTADDGIRDYRLSVLREVVQAQNRATKETDQTLKDSVAANKDAAQGYVQNALENLDQMDGAQRASARNVLSTWLATYQALGPAGAQAAKEIEDAIKRLDSSSDQARGKVKSLLAPDDADLQFRRSLNEKLGKPETADDARRKAEDDVRSLKQSYLDAVAEIDVALKQFGGAALTPDQQKTREGLEATRRLYQGFTVQIETAAQGAGAKAATAFTQAQSDAAASSALALTEAQYELAQLEGRDGSPAYLAGLNAALAYWRGRLLGLKKDTPEYLDALKKITELEGKVQAVSENPLIDRLTAVAQAVGKGGPLQKSITAGLDGLLAYFKAGGSKGGDKSLLAGASALIGGLAEVFKTGDEDTDQVINTFVSGVQATLGQLAKGDWIGAIVAGVATVVSTILDIFQGGKRSLEKAQKEIADATKNVKMFDLSKYAKVESRDGFWGWLGFKKATIDQEAVGIAQSLGDAIYSSVSTAFMDGVRQGKTSFSSLGLDIRKGLGEQILQGLIDGFLKGAAVQGLLQPFLDDYIAAMKSGNADALASAANGIQQAIGQANTAFAQFYEQVIVPTSQQLGLFGSQVAAETQTEVQSSISAGIQAPTAVMAAPAWAMDQISAFGAHTAALVKITPYIERLAAEGMRVTAEADIHVQAPRSDLRVAAAQLLDSFL